CVKRSERPDLVLDRRGGERLDCLEGPVAPGRPDPGIGCAPRILRPGHTPFFPRGQPLPHLRAELLFWGPRHLGLAIVADGLDQRAFVRLPRHDDGATVTTLEQGRQRVEAQSRFLLLRPVAPETVLRQHGTHLLFEKLHLAWRYHPRRWGGVTPPN